MDAERGQFSMLIDTLPEYGNMSPEAPVVSPLDSLMLSGISVAGRMLKAKERPFLKPSPMGFSNGNKACGWVAE